MNNDRNAEQDSSVNFAKVAIDLAHALGQEKDVDFVRDKLMQDLSLDGDLNKDSSLSINPLTAVDIAGHLLALAPEDKEEMEASSLTATESFLAQFFELLNALDPGLKDLENLLSLTDEGKKMATSVRKLKNDIRTFGCAMENFKMGDVVDGVMDIKEVKDIAHRVKNVCKRVEDVKKDFKEKGVLSGIGSVIDAVNDISQEGMGVINSVNGLQADIAELIKGRGKIFEQLKNSELGKSIDNIRQSYEENKLALSEAASKIQNHLSDAGEKLNKLGLFGGGFNLLSDFIKQLGMPGLADTVHKAGSAAMTVATTVTSMASGIAASGFSGPIGTIVSGAVGAVGTLLTANPNNKQFQVLSKSMGDLSVLVQQFGGSVDKRFDCVEEILKTSIKHVNTKFNNIELLIGKSNGEMHGRFDCLEELFGDYNDQIHNRFGRLEEILAVGSQKIHQRFSHVEKMLVLGGQQVNARFDRVDAFVVDHNAQMHQQFNIVFDVLKTICMSSQANFYRMAQIMDIYHDDIQNRIRVVDHNIQIMDRNIELRFDQVMKALKVNHEEEMRMLNAIIENQERMQKDFERFANEALEALQRQRDRQEQKARNKWIKIVEKVRGIDDEDSERDIRAYLSEVMGFLVTATEYDFVGQLPDKTNIAIELNKKSSEFSVGILQKYSEGDHVKSVINPIIWSDISKSLLWLLYVLGKKDCLKPKDMKLFEKVVRYGQDFQHFVQRTREKTKLFDALFHGYVASLKSAVRIMQQCVFEAANKKDYEYDLISEFLRFKQSRNNYKKVIQFGRVDKYLEHSKQIGPVRKVSARQEKSMSFENNILTVHGEKLGRYIAKLEINDALSPDATQKVLVATDKVEIVDKKTMRMVASFGEGSRIEKMCLLNDYDLLVIRKNQIELWAWQSKIPVLVNMINPKQLDTNNVVLTQEGKVLFSTKQQAVFVWDTKNDQFKKAFSVKGSLRQIAVLLSGAVVTVVGKSKIIVWENECDDWVEKSSEVFKHRIHSIEGLNNLNLSIEFSRWDENRLSNWTESEERQIFNLQPVEMQLHCHQRALCDSARDVVVDQNLEELQKFFDEIIASSHPLHKKIHYRLKSLLKDNKFEKVMSKLEENRSLLLAYLDLCYEKCGITNIASISRLKSSMLSKAEIESYLEFPESKPFILSHLSLEYLPEIESLRRDFKECLYIVAKAKTTLPGYTVVHHGLSQLQIFRTVMGSCFEGRGYSTAQLSSNFGVVDFHKSIDVKTDDVKYTDDRCVMF